MLFGYGQPAQTGLLLGEDKTETVFAAPAVRIAAVPVVATAAPGIVAPAATTTIRNDAIIQITCFIIG